VAKPEDVGLAYDTALAQLKQRWRQRMVQGVA
jgi:hypothetical protein